MAGVDQIIQRIEQENSAACAEILANAEAKALEITSQAKDEGEQLFQNSLIAAKLAADQMVSQGSAKADHLRKQMILSEKSIIIAKTLAEALSRIRQYPAAEYFRRISILVERFAQNGHGILCFSAEDLARIPGDFEAALNEKLAPSGRTVSISRSAVQIQSGCIIQYENIEQNCSFEALFEASKEELKDLLYREIFLRDSV